MKNKKHINNLKHWVSLIPLKNLNYFIFCPLYTFLIFEPFPSYLLLAIYILILAEQYVNNSKQIQKLRIVVHYWRTRCTYFQNCSLSYISYQTSIAGTICTYLKRTYHSPLSRNHRLLSKALFGKWHFCLFQRKWHKRFEIFFNSFPQFFFSRLL